MRKVPKFPECKMYCSEVAVRAASPRKHWPEERQVAGGGGVHPHTPRGNPASGNQALYNTECISPLLHA